MLNKVPVEMIDYDFGNLPSKGDYYTKAETYNKTEVDTLLEEAGSGIDYVNKSWQSNNSTAGWVVFTITQKAPADSEKGSRINVIIEGYGWGGVDQYTPFRLHVAGSVSGEGDTVKPVCQLISTAETNPTYPVCYIKNKTQIKVGVWLSSYPSGVVRASAIDNEGVSLTPISDVSVAYVAGETKPLKYLLQVKTVSGGGNDVTPESLNVYTKDQTYSKEEVYNKTETYSKSEVDALVTKSDASGILRFNYSNAHTTNRFVLLTIRGANGNEKVGQFNIIIEGVGYNTSGADYIGNFRLSLSGFLEQPNTVRGLLMQTDRTEHTTISSKPLMYKQANGRILIAFIMAAKGFCSIKLTSSTVTPCESMAITEQEAGSLPSLSTYTAVPLTTIS